MSDEEIKIEIMKATMPLYSYMGEDAVSRIAEAIFQWIVKGRA